MFSNSYLNKLNTRIGLSYFKQYTNNYSIKSKRSNWRSVVGLEIHAQINSESKLFSGSSTHFGSNVNNNVSLFDAAIPGTLPMLNKKCVESGILTALALSCRVNQVSNFDRKHYFYADLPAGYQITQQRSPLANDGLVNFYVYTPGIHKEPYKMSSQLKQLQLEQDSGKSLHDELNQRSLIDLNRAGIPLMELVFEPDLTDGEEAAALVKELILILTCINTCSCKMEEGALRVDANVSINRQGDKLGVRTEVKNISSIRGVANAVNFEIQRQIQLLENGEEIVNETRAWDAIKSVTVPMRDKEVKLDYRFMPEPNLPPVRVNINEPRVDGLINVEQLKETLPELPEESRNLLSEKYHLKKELMFTIANSYGLLQHFKNIMTQNPERSPKIAAKVIAIEFMTLVNDGSVEMQNGKLGSIELGEIVDLLQSDEINIATAKTIMREIVNGNTKSPKQIVEECGLVQISDEKRLKKICADAIENNPKIVAKCKRGNVKAFSSLLYYIAKDTNNLANMGKASKLLKEMLQT